MQWLKDLAAKFQALPTWQKFGIVGLVVAAIVLFIKWKSNGSSSVSMVDSSAAVNAGGADTSSVNPSQSTLSTVAGANDNGLSSLLTQYQDELQNSQLANQNALSTLSSQYQQLQRSSTPNPIEIAATQGVASAIGKGLNGLVNGLFGNNASSAATTAAVTNTATPYNFASDFKFNGGGIPPGVSPETVLNAYDAATSAGASYAASTPYVASNFSPSGDWWN